MSHLLPGERFGLNAADLKRGDEVFYLKTQRGGYGFVNELPAVVCGFTAHRVTIRLRVGSGKTVSVLASNLRLRAAMEDR